jgi:hypothetical protein
LLDLPPSLEPPLEGLPSPLEEEEDDVLSEELLLLLLLSLELLAFLPPLP